MAFPQTKTPLSLTVRKRQRRINSSAVPLLLPVQSPAPQCASNNARPVITGACRSRLLGRRRCPFSRKARRGSSHGRPALPCTSRQLSAAFFPGTLSRHSRIFHCHGVYSPRGLKSRDVTRLFFHPAHLKGENGSGNGWGTERCLCLKQGKKGSFWQNTPKKATNKATTKTAFINGSSWLFFISEWRDSNSRPPAPKAWNPCNLVLSISAYSIDDTSFYCFIVMDCFCLLSKVVAILSHFLAIP